MILPNWCISLIFLVLIVGVIRSWVWRTLSNFFLSDKSAIQHMLDNLMTSPSAANISTTYYPWQALWYHINKTIWRFIEKSLQQAVISDGCPCAVGTDVVIIIKFAVRVLWCFFVDEVRPRNRLMYACCFWIRLLSTSNRIDSLFDCFLDGALVFSEGSCCLPWLMTVEIWSLSSDTILQFFSFFHQLSSTICMFSKE